MKKHITDVFSRRYVFREVQKMFAENADLNSCGQFILEWLLQLYGHYITMAVRRELDRSPDAPTLRSLLQEMVKRPRVLSRARYLEHFLDDPPLMREIDPLLRSHEFDKLAGMGAYIDIRIIKKDIKQLDRTSRRVVHHANRIVAHRTPDDIELTIRTVDEALDEIESALQKYHLILTASWLSSAEPTIQFDWSKPFSMPWQPRSKRDA